MSSISKSAKSRRKKQRAGDRKVALDFIDVQFLHEMVGGESGFNLADLTLPTGSGSFQNPSPAVVASAANNMRTKLRLFNGAGKRLALGQEYEVVGTQINFTNIEAGVGEIFFGDIANVPRTGADFLDGEVKSATGFLIPGETQFNIGFDYRIGDKVSAANRKGPLQVERNRLTQYVNTIFETAGPAQDGDYAHVRAGTTAFGTVIEFNSPGTVLPSGLPEFISVETRQIIVDRNNESLRNEVQHQQASLVRIAEELGIIQSLDPNLFFQGSPTATQLKQHGDLVFDLRIRLAAIEAERANPLTSIVFGSGTKVTHVDATWAAVGASVALTVGTWKLDGDLAFLRQSGGAALLAARALWAIEDGDDTATVPDALTQGQTNGDLVVLGSPSANINFAYDEVHDAAQDESNIIRRAVTRYIQVINPITIFLPTFLDHAGVWNSSANIYATKIHG